MAGLATGLWLIIYQCSGRDAEMMSFDRVRGRVTLCSVEIGFGI